MIFRPLNSKTACDIDNELKNDTEIGDSSKRISLNNIMQAFDTAIKEGGIFVNWQRFCVKEKILFQKPKIIQLTLTAIFNKGKYFFLA